MPGKVCMVEITPMKRSSATVRSLTIQKELTTKETFVFEKIPGR